MKEKGDGQHNLTQMIGSINSFDLDYEREGGESKAKMQSWGEELEINSMCSSS